MEHEFQEIKYELPWDMIPKLDISTSGCLEYCYIDDLPANSPSTIQYVRRLTAQPYTKQIYNIVVKLWQLPSQTMTIAGVIMSRTEARLLRDALNEFLGEADPHAIEKAVVNTRQWLTETEVPNT